MFDIAWLKALRFVDATLQDLRMQLIAENGSVQRLDLPEDLKE